MKTQLNEFQIFLRSNKIALLPILISILLSPQHQNIMMVSLWTILLLVDKSDTLYLIIFNYYDGHFLNKNHWK